MSTTDKLMRDTAVPATDPLLSMQVGEFVIRERIGAGGMGVVYRADHPLIGKQAAIKVLRAELVSQEQIERLMIEGRAVNAIRHPGIIDIFGFGTLPDGRPYIIMELLQGVSLSALIRRQGRLDVQATVGILDQLLAALGAAHRAGVVHRDLKPGNVFLAEAADGTRSVKLVDFGIAKLLESNDGPTTVEGAILGTPEFMAPEQIRGKPVGPATDLYAVGVIAFQMLTGSLPFRGEPFQILFAQVERPPPPPSSRVPGVPSEFDTLVLHLMAKNPAIRPESAEAVRRALSRIPGGSSPQFAVKAHKPTAPAVPITKKPSVSPSAVLPTAHGLLAAQRREHGRRLVVASLLVAGLIGGTMLLRALKSPTAPALVATEVAENTRKAPPLEASRADVRVNEAPQPEATRPDKPWEQEQLSSGRELSAKQEQESTDALPARAVRTRESAIVPPLQGLKEDESTREHPPLQSKALHRRIEQIEKEVSNLATAGKLDDGQLGTAQRILQRYRSQAQKASTSNQLKQISDGLDYLERTYLK